MSVGEDDGDLHDRRARSRGTAQDLHQCIESLTEQSGLVHAVVDAAAIQAIARGAITSGQSQRIADERVRKFAWRIRLSGQAVRRRATRTEPMIYAVVGCARALRRAGMDRGSRRHDRPDHAIPKAAGQTKPEWWQSRDRVCIAPRGRDVHTSRINNVPGVWLLSSTARRCGRSRRVSRRAAA